MIMMARWNSYMQTVTAVTERELKSEFKLTKNIPYLALMGELLDVYCEDLGENLLRYSGTVPYMTLSWCIL